MTKIKISITEETQQVMTAVSLIELGARMQVLESEVTLSRDRLVRLYREIQGKSPPKGMLPFSADWFLTWAPNIHASVFANTFDFFKSEAKVPRLEALIKGFSLYLEHFASLRMEPLMDLTRGWTLVRFIEANMLKLAPCQQCQGKYVAHAQDIHHDLVCGICAPPSRAGKGRKTAVRPAKTLGPTAVQAA